ncbi:hypothetical protein GYMLUDRAFT_253498 [Collybiopsis luxurians FD-317 M1]|uniref:Unplaced genomic scaffold GYMLUscaffold_228, whole genome shotgun sequence n=1 Tax=Collybiopsis luxurians FD-317 M1 TaxID=944289 RepID=A0A0D0BK42_9AGAR|nr:hypothetical protein GYMLUDRAFT_253498 [Collybiopsis luxurians FD-317 M1]
MSVLQLHPSTAPPPPPPNPNPVSYLPGWDPSRFCTCPHTCLHDTSTVKKSVTRDIFSWPRNLGGRSNEHIRNKSFHPNCNASCPHFNQFPPVGLPKARPATLGEAIRATLHWGKCFTTQLDALTKRDLGWYRDFENQIQSPVYRALWQASAHLPSLIPSQYSNGGIGPDPDHLQFQDLPTHVSQSMRPFDVNAAMSGLPAMPGASVPGPGPVICGYNGPGAPSLPAPAPPSTSSAVAPGPSTSRSRHTTPAPPPGLAISSRHASPASIHSHHATPTRSLQPPNLASTASTRQSTPACNQPQNYVPPHGATPGPSAVTRGRSTTDSLFGRSPDELGRSSHIPAHSPSDPHASEDQLISRFSMMAVRRQGEKGLTSQWPLWPKDISKLPKSVLFLLEDSYISPHELLTLSAAEEEATTNFFWCILSVQMSYERRRLLYHKIQNTPILRRAAYVHVTEEEQFRNAKLYIWEWFSFALVLWDEGVDVEFMLTSVFYSMLESPSSASRSRHWASMTGYQFVFVAGSSDPARDLSDKQYHSLRQLSEAGIKFWPHPLSVKTTLLKSVTHTTLAPTIEKAGGFAERLFKVTPSDPHASEDQLISRFSMMAVRRQGEKGLTSQWPLWPKDISKLPKSVLFLLEDSYISPHELLTLSAAEEEATTNFFWCILSVQMSYERRRLLYHKIQNTPILRRAAYVHVTEEEQFRNAKLYIWEWFSFALVLWDEGVDVEFMLTSVFYSMLESPSSASRSRHWASMTGYQFVFVAGSSDPARDLSDKQYHSLRQLSEAGIKFWPHPLSVKTTLLKSVTHTTLAPTIEKAGGFAERLFKVTSLASGVELLQRGYVIKRDCSYESKHVFFPKNQGYLPALSEEKTNEQIQNFQNAWKMNAKGPNYTFFSLKFNPALKSLGEVRVFIAFGVVVDMIHTLPGHSVFPRPTTTKERCIGYLNDITKMPYPKVPAYLEFSQQRRQNELWHDRDGQFDLVGTQQVQDFALSVYDKLLAIEDSILRGNQYHRGVSGHKVLVRLDLGLIWDDRDPRPDKHGYKLIVNEIQPGDAGLFMCDDEARINVARGVVDGILRGSLDQ